MFPTTKSHSFVKKKKSQAIRSCGIMECSKGYAVNTGVGWQDIIKYRQKHFQLTASG
jgi:hypothetical protein